MNTSNQNLQFLLRLASPSYQAYEEQKRKDGEKPLSKEDWETRVLGKEPDSKPAEPKRKMSVEVKGAVMATSEAVHTSQSKGEEILRKALGDEAASKLIANRKTRDGDKAHVTLLSPPDKEGSCFAG